jgi:sterol desaturase/sphingolipid hydroxylase (fatty acid hydroxylase superfamily)
MVGNAGTVVTNALLEHEPAIRAGVFVTLLAGLALAERVRPCRGDARPAWRQAVNVALMVVDTLLVRVLFPVLGVGLAARLRADGVGLFATLVWPEPLELAVTLLALDLVIYFQHRLLHRIPLLWRAHRVHHSDLAFDVTLGVRFHPFEIALSQAIKLGAIAVLGAAPLAVLLFEILLQGGSLFTHADLALSARLDRALRWWIVTPSMHRVHHSVLRDETDSNFGFNVVWWDRLFGTYRAGPRRPETTMPIGLEAFREAEAQGLVALLLQPFAAAGRTTQELPRA